MANVLPLSEIKLDVTLWDGAVDKYVKATIKADGIATGYSPVALVHIGQGQYYMEAVDIIMPEDVAHLSIVYEIFTNNIYTIKSNQHSTVSEHYLPAEAVDTEIPILPPDIVDRVEDLLDQVENAVARMEQDDIEVSVEEIDEVEVHLSEDQEYVEVEVEEVEEIEVHILDDQESVVLEIDEDDEINIETEG